MQGIKFGKFISPHLIKYNERISIQNKNITNQEMENIIKRIQPKIEKYNRVNDSKITIFELETTIAILHFYENNCDFVVMETGLGGLYDCTNILNPIVSIITSIGYDHMHILGNTLLEITKQKAGIIKENSETIFVLQDENEVNNEIKKTCMEKNNKLHLIDNNNISNYSYDQEFQKFDYKIYKNIKINLKGKKQVYNASICVECVDILKSKLYNISEGAMYQALKTVIHKARFETISTNPLIIFDGAHNKPAIKNFVNSVKMYYNNKNKVYFISILKTKDYKTILKELLKDEKSTFIFTDGNNKEKYTPKEELFNVAKEITRNENLYIKEIKNVIDFVNKNYRDYTIFFVGSFYVYGTVIEMLKK